MTDHVIWWWTRMTISVKIFDTDIIIDTLCERFLSCSVVRRLKTKRLTRLSVYVERKNVCKWSLVYLQVGSYFKAFRWPNLFLTFCRVSIFFLLWNGNERGSTWKAGFSRWRNRQKRDKGPGKEGELKGLHHFILPPVPPCLDPPLGKT